MSNSEFDSKSNNGFQEQQNPYMPPAGEYSTGAYSPQETSDTKVGDLESLSILWGLAGILPPLVFWLRYKTDSKYYSVRKSSADTFNFIFCVYLISFLLSKFIIFGQFFAFLLILWHWIEIIRVYKARKEGRETSYSVKVPILR